MSILYIFFGCQNSNNSSIYNSRGGVVDILKIKKGGNFMPRKTNVPKISQVIYFYSGTDEEFNYFLKAVVKDYISLEFGTAENEKNEDETQ